MPGQMFMHSLIISLLRIWSFVALLLGMHGKRHADFCFAFSASDSLTVCFPGGKVIVVSRGYSNNSLKRPFGQGIEVPSQHPM